MIKEIFLRNFITIVAIIFSFITFTKSKGLDKKSTNLFILSMIILSILVIADSIDYYISQEFTTLNYLRYVTSIIGYSLKPCVILFIIIILLRHENNKRIYLYLIIPLIINFILCLISPFTKIVFSFNNGNYFIRGPLSFFPFAISGFYLVSLIVLTIKRYSFIDKNEILVVSFIEVAITVSIILEIQIGDKFLINGAGVLSEVFYYLYLYTQIYKRDTLTGLLNRNSFYSETESISGKLYLVCLDMNNLKKVNDNFGHDAGDLALSAISNAILNNISKRDRAYRVGGDEFTIIMYHNENDLKNILFSIENQVNKNGYSIAYGYEYFDGTDSIEKVHTRADAKMYQCKKEMKAKEMKSSV